jgi:hypothetical protein
MLALFAAVILTVVGLGWYLDWYKVRSQPASVPGQHSVGIDIDTKKIGTDLQKGEHKIQQFLENKNKNESKKTDGKDPNDNLMLPSPGLAPLPKIDDNDKRPGIEFHSGKGPSLRIGTGETEPLFQFETGKKGLKVKFGTDSEK